MKVIFHTEVLTQHSVWLFCVFCVVLCVWFCTGHFVVPLSLKAQFVHKQWNLYWPKNKNNCIKSISCRYHYLVLKSIVRKPGHFAFWHLIRGELIFLSMGQNKRVYLSFYAFYIKFILYVVIIFYETEIRHRKS